MKTAPNVTTNTAGPPPGVRQSCLLSTNVSGSLSLSQSRLVCVSPSISVPVPVSVRGAVCVCDVCVVGVVNCVTCVSVAVLSGSSTFVAVFMPILAIPQRKEQDR